jgi:hypothetical protein
MLEKLTNLPDGVVGVKAVGKLTKQDYETVFEPLLNEARRQDRRIKLLYELGPDFEGITPGAVWEDAKLGLRSLALLEGCAVVTDSGWIRESIRLFRFMVPCPVRVFATSERNEASAWLGSLPDRGALTHRLLPELGVIVVEVERPLRAEDFDSLAATADAWIEDHGELFGVVIHAREFPGWENLGSFLRHVRFVRDHHRKIKRIAVVADTKLAKLAPKIAEHFVKAEVKPFAYDQLESAIAWAGESAARAKPTPEAVARQ